MQVDEIIANWFQDARRFGEDDEETIDTVTAQVVRGFDHADVDMDKVQEKLNEKFDKVEQ